jgi:hypothetical protein
MIASDRALHLFSGLCGIVGPLVLVGSFAINPSPPPGLPAAALAAWAALREGQLLLGGWLQGIGSLLIVIFALALVELGGAASGFAGRIAQLAGATILAVSLIEVTFYLAVAQAVAAGDVAAGLMSGGLIKAVQHVFLIAPALLLPTGVVILRSRVLGRGFGYSALAIGACLQALGLAGVLAPLQPVVDVVLIVQAAWFVAAGVAMAVRGLGSARLSHLAPSPTS